MPSDTRVTVVVRPLDRLLNLVKVASIPVVAVAAATPGLLVLGGSLRSGHLALGIFVVIGALYLLASQSQRVTGPIGAHLAKVRRHVATACNHDEWIDRKDNPLACRATAEVFRSPLFQHHAQRDVVSKLTQACGAERPERYWFVEGDSGSGKTRMALRLVQSLVRDRTLFEVGNRCHLYDFAESEKTQDRLLRKLGSPRHDGAVVLVDNFQLVSRTVLQRLTARLVEGSRSPSERLLVFLARPGEAWSLGSGSDVRLLSEAKANARYLRLSAPLSETVADRVFDIDQSASQLIRDLERDYVASATQLHLAQVIVRNRTVPPEVRSMLRLLTDAGPASAEHASAPTQLLELLAILSALAMHRGSFSRRELRRGLRAARRSGIGAWGPVGAVRLRRAFRRLHRIGVVPKIHVGGTRYLFHDTLAEMLIDALSASAEFRQPFVAVGRLRLEAARAERQALDAWLVATEIDERGVVAKSFDEALSQGNYGRMTRCLQRARKRDVLDAPTSLRLAILLDRTGDFDASRNLFTDDLTQALSDSGELAAILATSRLEARHDEDSANAVEALRTQPDRLIAIVGEYWRLHIAAHRGRFAAQRLLEFASEALELVPGRESQWTTHSLARMHFDSLRHHYLAGGQPGDAIASPARRALDGYLRTRLPTYDAFHVLYGRAHLVGHVLLPQLGIYKQQVSDADAALAGVDRARVETEGALAEAARELYGQARDEFWLYGDREARYLQADVINAAMIQSDAELDPLLVDLNDYQRFVDATGFDDIASYPYLYFFRWRVLKHFEASGRGELRESDVLLADARRDLESVATLDAKVGNEYGLLRAELLGLLLDMVEARLNGAAPRPSDAELCALERRAADGGYGSERRLLRHLADPRSLSSAELRAIVRFYPFVHQ